MKKKKTTCMKYLTISIVYSKLAKAWNKEGLLLFLFSPFQTGRLKLVQDGRSAQRLRMQLIERHYSS